MKQRSNSQGLIVNYKAIKLVLNNTKRQKFTLEMKNVIIF